MDYVEIRIADLVLWLDARGSDINFNIPKCHHKFLINRPSEDGLYLRVIEGNVQKSDTWNPLYFSSETWELWKDRFEKLIFVVPEITPPERRVIVDSEFTNGEVICKFLVESNKNLVPYPLQNIEIKLFINWLANFGDIILHAVGIVIDGRGYCFAGASSSGKSTLAGALTKIPGLEIMGEDNIVLRHKDNHFWIYGTPWHLNSKMCSNSKAPLEKIFFLDRSIDPGMKRCDPLQGITRILKTAFIPYYRPETLPDILDRLNLLSSRVPFGLAHYQIGSDPGVFFDKV